jgi:hypothetical protein
VPFKNVTQLLKHGLKLIWHNVAESAPGRRERLPAHVPLRTVRESFPSHDSSLSKDTPVRSVPAFMGINSSILMLLIPWQRWFDQSFRPGIRPATQCSGVAQNTRCNEGHQGHSSPTGRTRWESIGAVAEMTRAREVCRKIAYHGES